MQKVAKPVGTRSEGTLGTIVFPVYDTITEASEKFGETVVLGLFNRAIAQDMERIARENLKKEGETEKTVQAMIDNYEPGNRAVKPTMKNFQALIAEFAESGLVDDVIEAHRIYKKAELEAAYTFLLNRKAEGALAA